MNNSKRVRSFLCALLPHITVKGGLLLSAGAGDRQLRVKQPCMFGAWDSDALHSVSSWNPRRKPRRVTWITVRRSKVRTHFFFLRKLGCVFFFSVRAQAKTSHFHILKAAVFSEGAAPSAEHHPGRFMKVHVLYRGQDQCSSHPNKIKKGLI